jgi:hypothetical protein
MLLPTTTPRCGSSSRSTVFVLVLVIILGAAVCLWYPSVDAFQGPPAVKLRLSRSRTTRSVVTARSPSALSTGGRRIIIAARTSGSHLFNNRPPAGDDDDGYDDDDVPTLVILVPKNGHDRRSQFGVSSPVESPSLTEAALHLADKTRFFCDGRLRTRVGTVFPDDDDDNTMPRYDDADIVLAYGLETVEELQMARTLFTTRREKLSYRQAHDGSKKNICHMGINCAESLPAMVGPYDEETNSILAAVAATFLPWSDLASGQRLHEKMNDLFSRATTDDFCTAIVLFLNQYVTPIDWVRYETAATWEKGIVRNAREFKELVTKCGDYLLPCVQYDSCRTCLTELTKVDPRDQALSYRTIVSYESDLLTKFTLCAFTKHNVFQCQASIPTIPTVPPLTVWRNAAVTDAVARALLIGHLQGEASAPSMAQRLDVSLEGGVWGQRRLRPISLSESIVLSLLGQ